MAENSFHYEFGHSEIDPSEALDSRGTKVTTVKCHGSLLAENRYKVEDMFKDTPFKGRIIIDLSHAIKESGVSVHFVEITPRVMQLLNIGHLADWFSS